MVLILDDNQFNTDYIKLGRQSKNYITWNLLVFQEWLNN